MKRRSVFPALLLVFLLVACDSVESEEQPHVTVRFIQSNVTDGEITDVAELAAFDVPISGKLTRDSAFAEAFSIPEVDPIDIGFGVDCGGRSQDYKDDIVFWFAEDSGSGEVIFSGITEACNRSFDGVSRSSSKGGATQDGTFYAFSIAGIGETSTVPLRLTVYGGRGSDDEHFFEYHPERHRLPSDHLLLHVDENDLGEFLPLEEAPGFTIEVTAKGIDFGRGAFLFALAQPFPARGTVNGKPFEGTKVQWQGSALSDRMRMTKASAKSSRITYLPDSIPDELDFYLVALGER